MKYNGKALSVGHVDGIIDIIEHTECELILDYAQTVPSICNGFSLSVSASGIFRKRIAIHIKKMRCIDDNTSYFIRSISLKFITLIAYLPDKLDDFLIDFIVLNLCAIFGRHKVLVALIFSNKQNLIDIGWKYSDDELYKNEIIDSKTAVNCIKKLFLPLTDMLSYINNVTENTPQNINERDTNLQNNDINLRVEAKKNKSIDIKLDRIQNELNLKIKDRDVRISKLKLELDSLSADINAKNNEIEAQKKLIDVLQLELKFKTSEMVKNSLDSITNHWLSIRENCEHEANVQRDKNSDILFQADEALAKQAAIEFHTGNRQTLRKRLNDVCLKLDEVQDAIANALNPSDELCHIERGLLDEKLKLQRLIGIEATTIESQVVKSLASNIGKCKTNEQLEEIWSYTENLAKLGIPVTESNFLYNLLSMHYDKLNKQLYRDNLTQITANPLLRFRQLLSQENPTVIVCDGHNIINSLDMFYHARSYSHEVARDKLVDIMIKLTSPYNMLSSIIVFDGPFHSIEDVTDSVTVMYSGGGYKDIKHRADNRIDELINWEKYVDDSKHFFLVTDDYELASKAKEYDVKIIKLVHFGTLVSGYL